MRQHRHRSLGHGAPKPRHRGLRRRPVGLGGVERLQLFSNLVESRCQAQDFVVFIAALTIYSNV